MADMPESLTAMNLLIQYTKGISVTAFINIRKRKVVAYLYQVYANDTDKESHTAPSFLVFMMNDKYGVIDEVVSISRNVLGGYSESLYTLIEKIKRPLEQRGIFIKVFDREHLSTLDIEIAFERTKKYAVIHPIN